MSSPELVGHQQGRGRICWRIHDHIILNAEIVLYHLLHGNHHGSNGSHNVKREKSMDEVCSQEPGTMENSW